MDGIRYLAIGTGTGILVLYWYLKLCGDCDKRYDR